MDKSNKQLSKQEETAEWLRLSETAQSSRFKDWAALRSSFLSTIVGLVLSVIGSLLPLLTTETKNPVRSVSFIIYIVSGFVVILVVFTVALVRIQRGSSKVMRLKRELQAVFLKSLDESALNPDRTPGGRHA